MRTRLMKEAEAFGDNESLAVRMFDAEAKTTAWILEKIFNMGRKNFLVFLAATFWLKAINYLTTASYCSFSGLLS